MNVLPKWLVSVEPGLSRGYTLAVLNVVRKLFLARHWLYVNINDSLMNGGSTIQFDNKLKLHDESDIVDFKFSVAEWNKQVKSLHSVGEFGVVEPGD